MGTIRVALAGVGNCASALLQGIHLYSRGADGLKAKPTARIGGYSIGDIEFVTAFDVSEHKVSRDLGAAIGAPPNCADRIVDVPEIGTPVVMGPVLDGLDDALRSIVPLSKASPVDVLGELRKTRPDVLVILLPSGASEAAHYYAEAAISAGSAVVNAIPVNVANDPRLVEAAHQAGVPLIGDDIKSQVGATIVHRALADLFPLRAARLTRTIQLDWGGDTDFLNLTSNGRYEKGKRQSKTEAVMWQQPTDDPPEVRVSAVDYIPFLGNTKEAYCRLEGRVFGERPVLIHVMMQVQDAYNSAGVLVDAIRVAKAARDRGLKGVVHSASAFFCKRPPGQMSDIEARKALEEQFAFDRE